MSVEVCERCHQLFHKTIRNICPNCVKEEEEAYLQVYKYLKRNKKLSDIRTISKNTGVSTDLIIHFLQEGRIHVGEESTLTYPCRECGAPIHSGAYCYDCQSEHEKMEESIRNLADNKNVEVIKEEKKKKRIAFYTRI